MLPANFELYKDHFIVNIKLPENNNGLINLQRDPRKQKIKPDVYVGIVEQIGWGCGLVKSGDKVCVERWEYSQLDVDDERIIAREVDLLVLANEIPAPGTVVMKLIDQTVKTSLIFPSNVRSKKLSYYVGLVQCSSVGDINPGEIIYVPRRENFQYRLGQDRLVFRCVDEESILMKIIPEYKMEEVAHVG